MGIRPYKILSLDGGGCWALIQIKALMRIFPKAETGHDVLRYFDLAAANSGGAIVLAGLAANFRLKDICDMFLDETKRRAVFVELPWWRRNPLYRWVGIAPKYETAAKLVGLKKNLRPLPNQADVTTLTLQQLTQGYGLPRFLIPTFDYDRERATFFRSDPNSAASGGVDPNRPPDPPMVEVVHAASNAPVQFFDKPALVGALRYWDGAIGGYNNPVMAAVAETLAHGSADEGVDPSKVWALSIGTGSAFLPLPGLLPTVSPELVLTPSVPGSKGDLKKMAMAIVGDPPDAASFVAHVVLGGRTKTIGAESCITDGPVVRMSPLVQPVKADGMWNYPPGIKREHFSPLVRLQMDAVSQAEVELVDELCEAWLKDQASNQPVRANRALDVEIGHRWFSGALAEAQRNLIHAAPARQARPTLEGPGLGSAPPL